MADKASVIKGEQQAVDKAYDYLEQRFRKNRDLQKPHWDTTDAKAGTGFIPEVPPELVTEADDLGGAGLVIKRVDVVEDDPAGKGTYYIGRRMVRTPGGKLFVISWNARMAKSWMLARSDQPGELLLRRDLRCDGRRVTGYFDDIKPRSDSKSETPIGADEAEGSTWLDLEDYLLEDLRRARGGRMRDIVETIQREQFILVSDDREGLLIVQGGPGTGKTAVGLHRISWLLYNEVFKADEVLVVGPHRGFLEYVGQVLPQLGTRGVTSVELARLWEGEVRGTDTLEARRVKSSVPMAELLRRAVDNLVNLKALEPKAARTVRLGSGSRPVVLPLSLLRRFAGAEGVRPPYRVRRRRFIDQLVDHLLKVRATTEPEQRSGSGRDPRAEIEQDSHIARLVDRVFPRLSAEELLRSLLRGKHALRAAAAGVLTERQQVAIVRPPAARVSEEPWSLEDLVCLEEIRLLMTGEPPRRYRHLVIDEAQDLTPMQARSLARRCPTGSMTILGDLAQATGVHQYAGWQELAGYLGAHGGGYLAELTIGYRVPREVMDLAAPLAAKIAPDTALPRSVRPPAEEQVVSIVAASGNELVSRAIEQVLALPGTDGKRARSVAFILPDDPALLDAARERVTAEDLSSTIQIRTAPEIKGLEFDHVVVLEPAAIANQQLARLYVAITRCTQTLTLVHSAPLPAILTPEYDPHEPTDLEDHGADTGQELPLTPEPESAAIPEATALPTGGLLPADGFHKRLLLEVVEERQSRIHEYLRYTLIGELFRAGRTPQVDSPLIDAACDSPAGWILYEVLGKDGHTYSQMRRGATRLKDIEFAAGKKAAHRFLVLPQEPEEEWTIEAITERHDVSVLWRTGSGWTGRHLDIALGRNQT